MLRAVSGRTQSGQKRKRSAFFDRKCRNRTCGTCIRCRRVRSWAEGKYAGKRRSRRPDSWTVEQQARLETLAGTMDRRLVAEVLSREFPDLPRSVRAVAVQASRTGVSLWPPGHSIFEIANLLGVAGSRVQTWVELGWLRTFQYESRAGNTPTHVRVRTDALEAFIRGHAEHFDAARVQGSSVLATLARERAQRKQPVRFSRRSARLQEVA